jgi:hypothetical protein
MEQIKYARFRDAREITVLKVEVNEGEGTNEDPIRSVKYLLTKDGKVLAKIGEEINRKFAGNNELGL